MMRIWRSLTNCRLLMQVQGLNYSLLISKYLIFILIESWIKDFRKRKPNYSKNNRPSKIWLYVKILKKTKVMRLIKIRIFCINSRIKLKEIELNNWVLHILLCKSKIIKSLLNKYSRLTSMNPLTFGDTIRLPVLNLTE